LRHLLLKSIPDGDVIDHCSLDAISKTGYDFLRSGSRQDTFFLDGKVLAQLANDYAMSLTLRFLTQTEPDGSTSLRMVTTAHSVITTIDFLERIAIAPDDVRRDAEELLVPQVPVKLIDAIPAPGVFNVLSFKVQADGGIRLYLEPNFFA